ncbi:MFS transporter [Mycolicibacterium baixiangningiae]|uniref:MFS transporter n=1 Tax=Mycolicibacterium baixiangningiae TaxID=2761578 RepID=UPI0018D0C610|nr:MFS transporter [Mycolicibacterium baixiangningiae]
MGTHKPDTMRSTVTRAQWWTLIVTMSAWGLDGFDGSLFTLVAAPAITEVLTVDGIAPEQSAITLHIGIAVSLYLFGWAIGSMTLGILADYFGRVRVLMIGIVTFAVFTVLTAFATEFWQIALFRFIAGIGSGVEYPVGAALIAETWNNKYRARATSLMASGYAAGYFLASVTFGFVGHLGWRNVMLITAVPIVIVIIMRRFVAEPEVAVTARADRRAQNAAARAGNAERSKFTLAELFSGKLRRTTLLAMTISLGSLIAFWSITTWVPQMIRQLSSDAGLDAASTTSQVALATAMLNFGGLIGYATWGSIADAIGRRRAFLVSMSCMWVGSVALFPWDWGFTAYMVILPLIGFGMFGAFSGSAVWFPELYAPRVRATALSFTNGFGRLITSFGPLFAGALALTVFNGNLQLAILALATVGLIALVGIKGLPETRGKMIYEGSDNNVAGDGLAGDDLAGDGTPVRVVDEKTGESRTIHG